MLQEENDAAYIKRAADAIAPEVIILLKSLIFIVICELKYFKRLTVPLQIPNLDKKDENCPVWNNMLTIIGRAWTIICNYKYICPRVLNPSDLDCKIFIKVTHLHF